jgi:hypothetical protein
MRMFICGNENNPYRLSKGFDKAILIIKFRNRSFERNILETEHTYLYMTIQHCQLEYSIVLNY